MLEVLALVIRSVEPYEPEQSVGSDSSEQVGDLRGLACGSGGTGLGDEYRVAGERPHGTDGRSEHLSKASEEDLK